MENVGVDDFPPPALWTESAGCDQSSAAVDDGSGDSLPSCLADKSAVSLLHELCMKRGLTPHYELTDSEGPVHQRVFTYNVTAGSFVATGEGEVIVFCFLPAR